MLGFSRNVTLDTKLAAALAALRTAHDQLDGAATLQRGAGADGEAEELKTFGDETYDIADRLVKVMFRHNLPITPPPQSPPPEQPPTEGAAAQT